MFALQGRHAGQGYFTGLILASSLALCTCKAFTHAGLNNLTLLLPADLAKVFMHVYSELMQFLICTAGQKCRAGPVHRAHSGKQPCFGHMQGI